MGHSCGLPTDQCPEAVSGAVITQGDNKYLKQHLALVLPAPLVSPWVYYAGAVAGVHGAGGAAVWAPTGAEAATAGTVGWVRKPRRCPIYFCCFLLQLVRGAQEEYDA